VFHACANCETTILFGGREYGGRRYCSKECEDWVRHPGFCDACLRATTDESSGGTLTLNGAGTRLAFRRRRCPTCGSYLQTLVFALLLVPIIPFGRYRVRWVTPKRFLSRRLRTGPFGMPP
jgi:hypothetical protein